MLPAQWGVGVSRLTSPSTQVLKVPTESDLCLVSGGEGRPLFLPNSCCPSDHLPLVAKYAMHPTPTYVNRTVTFNDSVLVQDFVSIRVSQCVPPCKRLDDRIACLPQSPSGPPKGNDNVHYDRETIRNDLSDHPLITIKISNLTVLR
jgi:hypothetical protein